MGVGGVGFAGAVWGSDEMRKILKKEAKKGKREIAKAIGEYHLAHAEVEEAIAKALSQETGLKIGSKSEMVETAMNAISLQMIFENKGGLEQLVPSLRLKLQKVEAGSQEALIAIASELSKGSKQKVPQDERVVKYDRDVISLKLATENPDLLYNPKKFISL